MGSLLDWFGRPSLRRRFAVWFGIVFLLGAVGLRLEHYRGTVGSLTRDVDVQLWSRLATVQAQERFAPDAVFEPHLRAHGTFLSDLPATPDWGGPQILGISVPELEPAIRTGTFTWFAGVWKRDGTLVDDLELPAGFTFDPDWLERIDTLWITADGAYRIAATAGAHDTLLVVGTPLAGLATVRWRAAEYQFLTFVIWVPIVLGVAWLALSRVLVPVASIAETARRIRTGRFEERIDVTRTDSEFGVMAGTINDMLDRLEAIRMSQSRFNADLAHQLMNPVHAILLESDAAAERERSQQELGAALSRIEGLARRIEAICEVLLAYSRSAAVDPTRLRAIDLEPVVVAAIDRAGPAAASCGVAIVPPIAGAVVKGEAALLEEVFVNLLVNAVEHSPAGGRIEVEVEGGDEGCRVAIIDHGDGVPAALQSRLFERFHSGKIGGGHGLGLALSRLIARSHGGDVTHEPTPGGGATFVVLFPRLT